jgi:ribonuclease HIII
LKKPRGRQISAFIPSFLVDRIIEFLKAIPDFDEVPATSRYEALRGRVRGRNVIVYRSGSVVYDESLEEVRSMLEEALYEHYRMDGIVVGSDEAGKGEALGPLAVAATALAPRQAAYLQSIGVADSKIVPENRIQELAGEIKRVSLSYEVLRISPSKLNEMFRMKMNLNDVLARGHSLVLKRVVSKIPEKPARIIVDKFDSSKSGVRMRIIERSLEGLRVQAVEKGEVFPAVAAASVLARSSYLTWVHRNLDEKTLRRLKMDGYSALNTEKEASFYFKISYLKDVRK